MNRRSLVAAAAVLPLASLPVAAEAAPAGWVLADDEMVVRRQHFPIRNGQIQYAGQVIIPHAELFILEQEWDYSWRGGMHWISQKAKSVEMKTVGEALNETQRHLDFVTSLGGDTSDLKSVTVYWVVR